MPTPDSCESCAYYRPTTEAVGTCKRFPPIMLSAIQTYPPAGSGTVASSPVNFPFPAVYAADWCGEFKKVT